MQLHTSQQQKLVVIRSYYTLSPYGTFWVVPAETGVSLWLGEERLGNYPTPRAACTAAVNHRSGHPAWDASLFDIPLLPGWGQLIQLGGGSVRGNL